MIPSLNTALEGAAQICFNLSDKQYAVECKKLFNQLRKDFIAPYYI
jgi:hypothetical protein